MPQMKPLMWLNLSVYFMLLLIFMFCMIYYSKNISSINEMKKYNFMNYFMKW